MFWQLPMLIKMGYTYGKFVVMSYVLLLNGIPDRYSVTQKGKMNVINVIVTVSFLPTTIGSK